MDKSSNSVTAVDTTVMAIREDLMSYFKGDCLNRTVVSGTITWRHFPSRDHYNHRYERLRDEKENRCKLSLRGVHLFTVQKLPYSITFHLNRLDRSKELQAVKAGVELFVSKHLRSVTVKYVGAFTGEQVDDTELVGLASIVKNRDVNTVPFYGEAVYALNGADQFGVYQDAVNMLQVRPTNRIIWNETNDLPF